MSDSGHPLGSSDLASLQRYESDAFFLDIRTHVESKIHKLGREEIYTLKRICGRDFWNGLEGVERNLAGTYVAFLVQTNQLPLISRGKNSANACVYEVR